MTALSPPTSHDDDPPVFICEKINAHQWRFWCPYCVRHHYHGAGRGHRGAHCTSPTSPLKQSGYVLEGPRFADRSRKRSAMTRA
jgi:hypothetical protein